MPTMWCVSACQAVTTPAMDVSHIMLEAYKKFILVSLIVQGKVGEHSALVVQSGCLLYSVDKK